MTCFVIYVQGILALLFVEVLRSAPEVSQLAADVLKLNV